MNLLKIGSINLPQNRWEDSLTLFDNIYIACREKEKEYHSFKYFKINDKSIITKVFVKLIEKFRYKQSFYVIEELLFSLWRVFAHSYISNIRRLEFDYVHSSYNFFDDSALITILLKNVISSKPVLRAYKETRPGFDYLELKSIKLADTIVLNTMESKNMLEEKYGEDLFSGKKVIFDLDEDYRKDSVIKNVKLSPKLSSSDGKVHITILAGECSSDCINTLLGSRQYYIPLITQIIEKGYVVHIHTLKIKKDVNGLDQYELLKKKYPNQLYIESGLDFESDTENAYLTLSRYDYGVLHNLNLGDGTSEFDKINISHRLYEYQIAHVVPIVEYGTTIVEERFLREHNCGLIYNDLYELEKNVGNVYTFFTPSFKEYILKLYASENTKGMKW